MLVKGELLDGLNRAAALQMELSHALDKRDTLAAGVTTLTAQIAELEGRLSAVGKGIASLKEAKSSDIASIRSAVLPSDSAELSMEHVAPSQANAFNAGTVKRT